MWEKGKNDKFNFLKQNSVQKNNSKGKIKGQTANWKEIADVITEEVLTVCLFRTFKAPVKAVTKRPQTV